MTDFGAGDGRYPQYDDARRGPSPDRRPPVPPSGDHDAPTAAQPAVGRRHSGLLIGDTGPVEHLSAPLPDLPWGRQQGDDARRLGAGTDPGRPRAQGDADDHGGPQHRRGRHRGPGEPHGEGSRTGAVPLPPLPSSAWSRLQHGPGDGEPRDVDSEPTDIHHFDTDWDDRTGGLEVIGAHVDEERPRRWRRGRRVADPRHDDPRHDDPRHDDSRHDDSRHDDSRHDDSHHDDSHHDEAHHGDGYHGDGYHGDEADLHDELVADPLADDDIPLRPYDDRRARARRRRRRVAGAVAVVVLAAVVLGIVFGGSKLIGVINPSARDYTGQGYGSVNIRVHEGDTLSAIARTLVDAEVLAGTGHFVTAAEANPAATGIAPGVYTMRLHMSGKAALDRLLDPASRLLSRVTIPEGMTVAATLKRLADQTHVSLADLQAAAKNTAALGLPDYAKGSLEGFLFPATYDFEPHTSAVTMLKAMVTREIQALDKLNIPADQRLTVVTKASLVQAEAGSVEDMGKIARVIDNRLASNTPLQLDTTVNYATGKTGLTTTAADRANPSPYNTYLHAGLPPGPISNPGEEALRAALSPTPGPWMFFVVVNPDTGETRFAVTAQEHQANVALFQQWLRAHPNG